MSNGVVSIFSQMREDRMNATSAMNEEQMNEMSRDEEKDIIKKARPVIQKIAYANKVTVKNPAQNKSRFIIIGEGASDVAKEAAKAVKERLGDIEDVRIKAAKVSSADKEKYNVDGECAAVIVDAPGATDEEFDMQEELDEALEVEKKATNGKAFTVEINGKKYSYYPTEESGLTAKELGEHYSAIAKHNKGRALVWLKKNATTPNSYKKEKVTEEEEVNEEITIDISADDILKAAKDIEKAGGADKVVVTTSASGIKVTATEEPEPDDNPEDKKEPEENPDEKDEECGSKDKDEEVCPQCGKKHKKGEKCCEDKTNEEKDEDGDTEGESEESPESSEEPANEEVDVAELAARLDECEGSDYMKKALEAGKYDLVKKYLYLKEEN